MCRLFDVLVQEHCQHIPKVRSSKVMDQQSLTVGVTSHQQHVSFSFRYGNMLLSLKKKTESGYLSFLAHVTFQELV